MHLSMFSPTTPLGQRCGYSGRFDSKPLPHPGAFDLLLVFKKCDQIPYAHIVRHIRATYLSAILNQ